MTSSYGYQRPLSSQEQLYLQNQALQAELQRREQEKPGDFIDVLGKTALAAGAVAGAGPWLPAFSGCTTRKTATVIYLSTA